MKTNKFLSVLLTLIIFIGIFTIPVSADDNIKVLLNDVELTFDVPPQLINDRTMVPMRKIFEALGAQVDWDDETQTITATKNDIIIIMQIDNVAISVNEKEVVLDVPPQLVESRTLVPVRAVAEGLDADVEWDDDTQTVIITKEEKPIATPSPEPSPTPASTKKVLNVTGELLESYTKARYAFEQTGLPQYLFKNETTVAEYIINANVSGMEKIVSDEWDKVAKAVRSGLAKADEFLDVTIEKLDDNTNVVIVDLAVADTMLISTYIGVVYNKDIGIKYFTLEKSMGDYYMFCFVDANVRGSYFSVDNDKAEFIDAIKAVVGTSLAPALTSDEIATIDGVKYVLDVTVYVMDVAPLDEGLLSRALVSVYDDKGKDITSTLTFSSIELTKGTDIKKGTVDKNDNYEYKFFSNWKSGDNVDVTVEVEDSKGDIVKLSAKNVEVGGFANSLQSLLGSGVKIEIH